MISLIINAMLSDAERILKKDDRGQDLLQFRVVRDSEDLSNAELKEK
jgi:hypothetical protein